MAAPAEQLRRTALSGQTRPTRSVAQNRSHVQIGERLATTGVSCAPGVSISQLDGFVHILVAYAFKALVYRTNTPPSCRTSIGCQDMTAHCSTEKLPRSAPQAFPPGCRSSAGGCFSPMGLSVHFHAFG